MGIIAAGQITVVDLSDAPVLNAFITASRPTTQTYSKDSKNYNPSYASTPQVLTLNVTKAGSTTSIIDSISGLHWFVVDGSVKTEITSKVNTSNEYISGNYNENLTTKLNINTTKGYRRYEATGVWRDPSTDLDVQFSADIDLLLTQNGATGPQGPQGDDGPQGPQGDKGETGNGIANTVVTYGLSMSDTTEPATWSSDRPALVKGMYLWVRTVIIYTNGESTTSYQISYIPKDADATGEIDKTKQELLEKLETVRDDSLAAVEEAKEQLETVRNDSLAAAEEAKQQVTTVADDLSKAKTDFQNAVNTVDTKATNVQNALTKAKQDLASQAQQLREQANAQSELTNRVSLVEETANGTKTTVSELSKTVDQNGKDITSVTARTKVVEDDLSGTKTTLSQVKMTADSTSQKTATLETGLSGLSAKFDNLKIGGRNLLVKTNQGKTNWSWAISSGGATAEDYDVDDINAVKLTRTSNNSASWSYISYSGLRRNLIEPDTKYTLSFDIKPSVDVTFSAALKRGDGGAPLTNAANMNKALANKWTKVSCVLTSNTTLPDDLSQVVYLQGMPIGNGNWLIIKNIKLEKGNVVTDYSSSDADIEQKIAEYKQNADQNYASLQSTVQNLDGTVQHNKTVADQTAQGFTTRIESLETYKSGESTRANQYFELAKTETARQLTAERTAIAKDYVAKSTYTSDVTGIRNELSVTTTTANTIKTNLANYQASNDRAVANLQSNLQTANGNISSLKTKVEAVPGQITSAVSAVEGKIPTEIGTVNLLKNSKSFSGPNITGSGTNLSETYQGCTVRRLKVTGEVAIAEFRNCVYPKLGGEYVASFWAKGNGIVNIYFYGESGYLGVASGLTSEGNTVTFGDGRFVFNLTADWKRYWVKYKLNSQPSNATNVGKHLLFRTPPNGSENDVYLSGVQLEEGNVVSGYEPAPEDTAAQINSLSSQIKQTADGITLLATKTELNSAKNELKSGIKTATDKANSNAQTISTHTTQISALNNGLNAKVSQSDFNTLSGRVTTAENNIIAKANELSSKITSVEGKIPSGEMNLVEYGRPADGYSPYNNAQYTTHPYYYNSAYKMYIIKNTATSEKVLVMNRFKVERNTDYTLYFKGFNNNAITNMDVFFLKRVSGSTQDYDSAQNLVRERKLSISKAEDVSVTFNSGNYDEGYIRFDNNGSTTAGTQADLYFGDVSVKKGKSNNGWSPSLAELASSQALKSTQSELKQTKDGITLLATKTELNTAKNELKSGIKTATDKANNNAQTISTHTTQISALNTGLNAKVSQSDFNTLSGRVTTAENNITAKANELSSKITSVEGKIPKSSGGRNLAQGTSKDWSNPFTGFSGVQNTCPSLYKVLTDGLVVGDTFKTRIVLKYTNIVPASGKTAEIWLQGNGNVTVWNSGGYPSGGGGRRSIKGSGEIIFELTDKINADHLKNAYWNCSFRTDWIASGSLQWKLAKAERGMFFTDWSPAPEDAINQINSLSSEFKQTTDAIKASVTSLNNSTVKSSSLTINSDGIVMKAGKSTTDVANAIGSYFAVNQNAINMFSDKINVKGNMIVSGAITGDKIAANSINSSKIVSSGITANVIKGGVLQSLNGSTNFELDTGKLFYNNNNTGVFRVQNGASTMGLKFSNTSLTVNGTSRILSRAILGGDRRESTLDDGKWDKGGFSGIVIETIKGVEPTVNENADALRVIADNIYFTHTYSNDSLSARGWKMETYSPNTSYPSNVVLKPYGINYRNSNIVVGDLRLDNGDGSGYWMRATINVLKACFGHILNGGTSSQALNAIRSELNKISGT